MLGFRRDLQPLQRLDVAALDQLRVLDLKSRG